MRGAVAGFDAGVAEGGEMLTRALAVFFEVAEADGAGDCEEGCVVGELGCEGGE